MILWTILRGWSRNAEVNWAVYDPTMGFEKSKSRIGECAEKKKKNNREECSNLRWFGGREEKEESKR